VAVVEVKNNLRRFFEGLRGVGIHPPVNKPAANPEVIGRAPNMRRRLKRTLDTSAFQYGADNPYVKDFRNASGWASNPYLAITSIRRIVSGSSLAQAYLRQLAINVVGARGPTPTFNNVESKIDRKALSKFWERWACDPSANGKTNWPQFLRALVSSQATDGRVFVVMRRHSDYPFGFALMPVIRDWIVDSVTGSVESEYQINGVTHKAINGVVRGKSGRIKGYLFYDALTPTDVLRKNYYYGWSGVGGLIGVQSKDRVFIPAEDVCDFMMPRASDDYEGSPSFLLPMVAVLKRISEIDESVATAMYAASCKMGFITKTETAPQVDPDAPDYVPPPTDFERVSIEELPSGHDFKPFDPSVPNADIWRYRQELVKNMCAGLGVDYATLAGDLREVNFSSMRHGAIAARENYRLWQRDLERLICRPVLTRLLDWATLMGYLKLKSRKTLEQATMTDWRHLAWAWVDPLKDAAASELLVKMGATSPQQVCAGLGNNYESVIADVAEAKRLLEQEGLTPADLQALAGAGGGGSAAGVDGDDMIEETAIDESQEGETDDAGKSKNKSEK